MENSNYEKAKNTFKKLFNHSKNEIVRLVSANNLAIAMKNEKKYEDAIQIFKFIRKREINIKINFSF